MKIRNLMCIFTITVIQIIFLNVNNTYAENREVTVERTISNYDEYEDNKTAEFTFKFSNLDLKKDSQYEYSLNVDGVETSWYQISNLDIEKKELEITLKHENKDILKILKKFNTTNINIIETDVNQTKTNIVNNMQLDIKEPLSKTFKVGHYTPEAPGHHAIKPIYEGTGSVEYQYLKVDNIEIIEKYLEYLKNADSQDDIYWGYYVDNLIDEILTKKDIPKDNWLKYVGTRTSVQPEEKGLYFIWIRTSGTETNKELNGCVFSKRFSEISELEEQLEETKQKKLEVKIEYKLNKDKTKATARIIANNELEDISGWDFTETKTVISKDYFENKSEIVTVRDVYGNEKKVQLEITGIIKELVATVKYNPTSETTESVTAIIKTNKEVNKVQGWLLSEDGMMLTNKFQKNGTETVHLVDIDKMTKDVEIKITNIKEGEKDKDNTTANEKLPDTGINMSIVVLSISVVVVSIVMYQKSKNYKDIK